MHRIGVMGGDGVGPELVSHGIRVLERVSQLCSFEYDLVWFPHSGQHYRDTGILIEDSTLTELSALDALFFGAAGDPGLPEGTMERGLLGRIVSSLDLGIGVRPGVLYTSELTPLRDRQPGEIDMVIVRDTSEDAYVVPGGFVRPNTADEISIGMLVYTRMAVERTTRHAFELARVRRGRVTLVCQSNGVQAHEIWRRVFVDIASDYPDVECRQLYPDAAAMVMVSKPEEFDVILTTLWIGGILSDLLAALIGGVGIMGSARLDLERQFGLFEPAHGSAPKHVGTDRVSPIGTLRSLAMLLDFVGENGASSLLDRSIEYAFKVGDISSVSTTSKLGTTGATDAVVDALTTCADAAVGN